MWLWLFDFLLVFVEIFDKLFSHNPKETLLFIIWHQVLFINHFFNVDWIVWIDIDRERVAYVEIFDLSDLRLLLPLILIIVVHLKEFFIF